MTEDERIHKFRLVSYGLGAMALFMLVPASILAYHSYLFVATASSAKATVTAVEHVSGPGRKGRKTDSYRVTVRFSDQTGRTYIGSLSMGSRYRVGDAMEVLYDPAKPDYFRSAHIFASWGFAIMLGVIGTVSGLLAIACRLAYSRLRDRQWQMNCPTTK